MKILLFDFMSQTAYKFHFYNSLIKNKIYEFECYNWKVGYCNILENYTNCTKYKLCCCLSKAVPKMVVYFSLFTISDVPHSVYLAVHTVLVMFSPDPIYPI